MDIVKVIKTAPWVFCFYNLSGRKIRNSIKSNKCNFMESIKDIINIKSKLFCKRVKSNKNYNKLSYSKGKILNRSRTNIFKQEEIHINN